MSWLRTAVSRVVEVGGEGPTNFTRTVRSYADTVVQQAGNAVTEGAKIFQDRMGPRNVQNFRQTVKRLEEVSVSCRGAERVQLLRRWLVALKEIERFSVGFTESNDQNLEENLSSDESKDSPKKPTPVYYVDPDEGGEPRTFRDVFLYCQALEGITLSMILEAPNEEESSLLLEIYRLCLTGGQEVNNSVMNSVQTLAKTFSEYQDEVLVKREELLQYAQDAIAGLKINADLARIDAEACSLKETLDKETGLQQPSGVKNESSSDETALATVKGLQEALAQIQLFSKLEELLLKKKSLSNGDSPKQHGEKVDKLKVLSESLSNSTYKAEKRISDHRVQKEEALHFRVAKADEITQAEKDLAGEIKELEKQKEELEAELKRVNSLLAAACVRLHNAKEERDQFDEASNQILVHLKTKEDELFRSIASCRIEAEVVDACVHFLEQTWGPQAAYSEEKEKLVNDELETYQAYFVNLVIHLLSSYKEKLGSSISRVRILVETLSSIQGSGLDGVSPNRTKPRKKLEEEYQDIEAKFVTTLSIVDTIKKKFDAEKDGIARNVDQKVQQLLDALEKIKEEFESIKRPILEIETPTQRSYAPFGSKPRESSLSAFNQTIETLYCGLDGTNHSSTKKGTKVLDPRSELASIVSGFGSFGRHDSAEEINDWEFDEFRNEI